MIRLINTMLKYGCLLAMLAACGVCGAISLLGAGAQLAQR